MFIVSVCSYSIYYLFQARANYTKKHEEAEEEVEEEDEDCKFPESILRENLDKTIKLLKYRLCLNSLP